MVGRVKREGEWMMSISKEGTGLYRQKTLNMEEGGREEAGTGRRSRRGGGGKCSGSWLRQESHSTWDVG